MMHAVIPLYRLGAFLSLPLVLFLTACGTAMEVHYPSPEPDTAEVIPARFSRVVLEVGSSVPDTEEARKLMRFALEVEFLQKHKQLVQNNGDLEVSVVITGLKDVPRESRVWLGSLAGRAEMRTEIRVKGRQGKVSRFAIETLSQGATSSADFLTGKGGSTQDMVERTAAAIVAEIVP